MAAALAHARGVCAPLSAPAGSQCYAHRHLILVSAFWLSQALDEESVVCKYGNCDIPLVHLSRLHRRHMITHATPHAPLAMCLA